MVKAVRLSELASEASLELDEALVTLWDGGLESVDGPDSQLGGSDLTRARRLLGIPGPRDLGRCSYWRDVLNMSDQQFLDLTADLGIKCSADARRLPKGAVQKLRRIAAEKSIPVIIPAKPIVSEELPPEPELQWRCVGRERLFRCLTADELIAIHETLVADFAGSDDPIDPPGLRDVGLIHSAAMRPETAHGEEKKYPTVEMATAALMHSVVHNHAFHNGNKRAALVALLVFLDENGFVVTADEADLFRFVLRVAQHRLVPKHWSQRSDREVLEIAQWIRSNSRLIDKTERLVKWRKLRGILASYGCNLSHGKVGNRMNVERTVKRGRIFPRDHILRVQVAYGDEGREVERDTLKRIRQELQLDEEHGIDSEIFYGSARAPSDFILQYRKILSRLAKL